MIRSGWMNSAEIEKGSGKLYTQFPLLYIIITTLLSIKQANNYEINLS